MVKVGDVKKMIREDLGLSVAPAEQPLTESYVATPKEYDLATELLSEKTKKSHFTLYQKHIEALNAVSARQDTVDRRQSSSSASGFRSLKVDEIANRNSVYLHELYFANISDLHSEVPFDSLPYMKLSRDFGTFDDWQWDFMACALASRGGWAVCAFDTYLKRYINFSIDGDDCHIPVGCYPVVVIDMVEHSYYRDYQEKKDEYLINMMRELNWEIIERRVEKAEAVAKAIS